MVISRPRARVSRAVPCRKVAAASARNGLLRQAVRQALLALTLGGTLGAVTAAELPVACSAGICGIGGPGALVLPNQGSASLSYNGNTLTVNQTSDRAVLNFASFNISADGRVVFAQPSSSSIALNRIYQDNPSVILGQLTANGQVYLINPNGFVFGKTARIDAAGLLASTLSLSDQVFDAGIASSSIVGGGLPALQVDPQRADRRHVLDRDGNVVTDAEGRPIDVQLIVEPGAVISTNAANGRILLAGQQVISGGTLRAPDGQVILAAGEKVYLKASDKPELRGLLVEVDAGGQAWNQLTGDISSARGNVTLVGMAVNQDGRISASTSVSANGSIRLLARDTRNTAVTQDQLLSDRGGTLEFGGQSVTSVVPEIEDVQTAVDDQPQMRSSIEGLGRQVTLRGGASVVAPGGDLTLVAAQPERARGLTSADGPVGDLGLLDADARLRIESGVNIDLAGSQLDNLSVKRNFVSVELRANELRDSPNQRNGGLRGRAVVIDGRLSTPIGDVSGAIAAIPRTVGERTASGGNATFLSDGDIVVADGARVDVSGGALHYQGGVVQSSFLIGADGKLYDVGTADPGRHYVGVIGPTYRRADDRYGRIDLIATPTATLGHREPGYTQGMDAGRVQFASPNLLLNGTFIGNVVNGPFQRTKPAAGGQLIIGLSRPLLGAEVSEFDYRSPDVSLVNAMPSKEVSENALFEDPTGLQLSTDFLRNGFTRTEIYSNGNVAVASEAPLTLSPGSLLLAQGRRVDIRGDVSAQGGDLAFRSVPTIGAITRPPAALPIEPLATAGTETTLVAAAMAESAADAREGVFVAPDVKLDVRGSFVNDFLLPPGARTTEPLLTSGGSIELALVPAFELLPPTFVQGIEGRPAELALGNDVQLLASGGAQVTGAGRIVGGSGGSIALTTSFDATLDIGKDVKLDGYGVQGASGGSFQLRAPKIAISAGTQWAEAQRYDANDPEQRDKSLQLGTALFDASGFGKVTLTANRPIDVSSDDAGEVASDEGPRARETVLQIDANARINAQVSTLILEDKANRAGDKPTEAVKRPTGGVIANFSRVLLPEAENRRAATLSFNTTLTKDSLAEPTQLGALVVQSGAVLQGDPGTVFAFGPGGDAYVDAHIRTPGGAIVVDNVARPSLQLSESFFPQHSLIIGAHAVLDVSGTTVLAAPRDDGTRGGRVLDGGSISLTTNLGSVRVDEGAVLDVSGASDTLDLRSTTANASPFERVRIGSSAGSVLIRASESFDIQGTVRAHAGASDRGRALGGTLAFELTRGNTFPPNPRVIELGLASRVTTESTLGLTNGVAALSQEFLAGTGADAIALRADDAIRIESGVTLVAGRKIELNSPVLALAGETGEVRLQAPYVALGRSRPGAETPTPTTSDGLLDVRAGDIDLVGTTVLQGFGRATLSSKGDIRLRPADEDVPSPNAQLPGSFSIAGDLTLAAARVYATTNTRFTVEANGGDADRVRILQQGAVGSTPLSANSSIKINARTIDQEGTLLAPFGSIELNGSEAVTLADGSITSVSGAGQALIPYGSVITTNRSVLSYGQAEVTALPQRQVTLNGDAVTVAPSATVDVSGGGELYAYEFVPGAGGSKDALSASQNPELFAILPGEQGRLASFDTVEYQDSSLRPGDSIYLGGADGVPAGVYPLLPARYALLPGAFLVSAVPGTTNLLPGSVSSLRDGTRVIAGYRTFGDTQLNSGNFTGFTVRPGSYGRQLAAYNDYTATGYLTTRAQQLDAARPALPADAGSLALTAGRELNAFGTVRATTMLGGVGAAIEVAATHLEVVSSRSAGTVSTDNVQIGADFLAAGNPARVVLGGSSTRLDALDANSPDDASSNERRSIVVNADTVTIKSGTQLRLNEVVIVARQQVAVEANASVASPSGVDASANPRVPMLPSSPTDLVLSGEGNVTAALLAVSDVADLRVQRDAAGGNGTLQLMPQSRIASRGAIALDAPGSIELGGALVADRARVALGTQRIAFGGTSAQMGGVLITPEVEAQLQAATALRLTASEAIVIERSSQLDLSARQGSRIELDAPLIDGTTGGMARYAADEVLLTRSPSLPVIDSGAVDEPSTSEGPAMPTGGTGLLQVQARRLQIGPGALDLAGFGKVSLQASEQLQGRGLGGLRSGGDVDIATPLFTVRSDADTFVHTAGALRLTNPAGLAPSALPLSLGGAIDLQAQSLDVATAVVAPAGLIRLRAEDSLRLDAGANLDVAGRSVTVGPRQVGANGGAIFLSSGGDIHAAATSRLDVSGVGSSPAGRVNIAARGAAVLAGTLQAQGAAGGNFDLQAASLDDFAGLAARLREGGFTVAQRLRVGSGDLVLGKDERLTAASIALIADSGEVRIAGEIIAPSTDFRGSIRLYGARGVTLEAGGVLSTDGETGAPHGGDIELGTSLGTIDLAPQSRVSARGERFDGALWLRAPALTNDIGIKQIAAQIGDVSAVVLEPVIARDIAPDADPTSVINTLDALRQDGSNYIATAGAQVLERLTSSSVSVLLRPALELRAAGDLTIDTSVVRPNVAMGIPARTLELSRWRFNGQPGSLTVRAAGNLSISGTISDGVTTVGTGAGARLDLRTDASTSITLTAGADFASADPTAVLDEGQGSLAFGAGTLVRTGTGSLSLAAAQDITFDQEVSLYTTGLDASGLPASAPRGTSSRTFPKQSGSALLSFPDRGGNIRLMAGNDVLGSAISQSATEWQFRGTRSDNSSPIDRLTGISLSDFKWNVGALGGGDVTVSAGRDVLDLSAAVASSARVVSRQGADALEQYGGGSLSIGAARDIGSGNFYALAGSINARAGRSFSAVRDDASGPVGTLLWLGDTRADLYARRDLTLASALDPGALLLSGLLPTRTRYFFSYSENSSLNLQSAGGNVSLQNDADALTRTFIGNNDAPKEAFQIYPASLTARALTGDVVIGRQAYLFPAARGQLDLFAARDLRAVDRGSGILMSDAAIADVGTIVSPAVDSAALVMPILNAGAGTRHLGDTSPVQITAGRDVVDLTLELAKQGQLFAGRDISQLTFNGQNIGAGDLTLIQAGRDITSPTIQLGGPGRLDILAGRQIDLGTEFAGITTGGRLFNASLPSDAGADVTLVAGLGRKEDFAGFIDRIIAPQTDVEQLRDYVATVTGKRPTTEEALTAFRGLSMDQQRPFIHQVFFSELVSSGREANRPREDMPKVKIGYERSYRAIDALFPGSRDPSSTPYAGSLQLAFSRVYTFAGGDINVLAPGGLVNVGASTPPTGFENVDATQLGIVAQREGSVRIYTRDDVLVNSSRVFTLLGGDITIYSTLGNIDAGRGAKSAVTAPPPRLIIDADGKVKVDLAAAAQGSGIRTILTSNDVEAGDVDLIAPIGFVNAGDAGIGSAGNLNIAAATVIGTDNIQVGGNATGVPAETSGLGVSLAGVSNVASGSSNAADSASEDEERKKQNQSKAPLADTAMSWLEVFVIGLGEETCKQDDVECLKRQK